MLLGSFNVCVPARLHSNHDLSNTTYLLHIFIYLFIISTLQWLKCVYPEEALILFSYCPAHVKFLMETFYLCVFEICFPKIWTFLNGFVLKLKWRMWSRLWKWTRPDWKENVMFRRSSRCTCLRDDVRNRSLKSEVTFFTTVRHCNIGLENQAQAALEWF